MTDLLAIAEQYRGRGLCAIPADRLAKQPIGSWKRFQKAMPPKGYWKREANAICLVAGKISGNLEIIDFDLQAELFPAWERLLREAKPGLFEQLTIERSQSGGRHVFYRCPEATIEGNQDLAQRRFIRENGDEFTYNGKTLTPALRRGQWIADATFIETRGEGGIILTAPSPGYVLEQGSFDSIPKVTPDERNTLLGVARALHEIREERRPSTSSKPANGTPQADRPGDDFNARCDFLAYLESKGWEYVTSDGENKLLRRPGKKGFNWSASLLGKSLYVFSTNAGLPANESYSPFGVYAHLEHDGDFEKAAAELGKQGYGAPLKAKRKFDESEHNPRNDDYIEGQLLDPVDISGIVGDEIPDHQRVEERLKPLPLGESETVVIHAPPTDPEPMREPPLEHAIFSIPGFIDEVIDYTMQTAPYPSQPLAFCGALSLLSILSARKLRGPTGLLTNIMVLALANSGSGKDHPRQINSRILSQVGLDDRLIGKPASGQGLEDAVMATGSVMAQIDEFDSVLVAVNKSGDAIAAGIGASFMEFYSSSQHTYRGRVKANEPRRSVKHPHVTLFGTAVPSTFYGNLTDKLLSNGLVARMIVVENGPRGQGRLPKFRAIPQGIIDAAEFWRDFRRDATEPLIIDYDDEAQEVFIAEQKRVDEEYDRYFANGDNNGCAIWARVTESAHKLAILYAASEDRGTLQVKQEAAMWAISFSRRQANWFIEQAAERAGEESEFERIGNKILARIKKLGGRAMRSEALRASKVDAKKFDLVVATLQQRGQLRIVKEERAEWYIAL